MVPEVLGQPLAVTGTETFITTLNILRLTAVKYLYRSQAQCTLKFFLQ